MTSGLINTGHENSTRPLAAASLENVSGGVASVAGFSAAFTGAAIVATIMAVATARLVPAGRPPATDGPVFAR